MKISKIKIALVIIKKIKNWPLYALDYFKLVKNKNIIFFLKSGLKVELRAGTSDKNIINDVLIQNIYTPKGFEIKNGDTVIDIGAHIGTFSLFASFLAQKVYAFEPALANFRLLEQNIKINGIKNIKPINSAVSGKTEERELFVNKDNMAANSFYFKANAKNKVQTISLEDIFKQNKISKIDYLKLDCEGAEYEILFNCSDEVLNKIEKIGMECHDLDETHNLRSLKGFLEKNDYRVTVVNCHCQNESLLYASR